MHFIVLTPDQVELAALRFDEHGNSASHFARHLHGEEDYRGLSLSRGLRRLERELGVDLGTLCFKFLEAENGEAPVVQNQVMDYVATRRGGAGSDALDLVVSVDRALEIGRLAEGKFQWQSSPDS